MFLDNENKYKINEKIKKQYEGSQTIYVELQNLIYVLQCLKNRTDIVKIEVKENLPLIIDDTIMLNVCGKDSK